MIIVAVGEFAINQESFMIKKHIFSINQMIILYLKGRYDPIRFFSIMHLTGAEV